MKLILAVLVLGLVVEAQAQWYRFPDQAIRGHLFFTSIKLEANWRHIWHTFTVSCRWKRHVARLPRYEEGQLEGLWQIFPCTWELWCCQTWPRRQVGRQSDQVRTEYDLIRALKLFQWFWNVNVYIWLHENSMKSLIELLMRAVMEERPCRVSVATATLILRLTRRPIAGGATVETPTATDPKAFPNITEHRKCLKSASRTRICMTNIKPSLSFYILTIIRN